MEAVVQMEQTSSEPEGTCWYCKEENMIEEYQTYGDSTCMCKQGDGYLHYHCPNCRKPLTILLEGKALRDSGYKGTFNG